MSLGVIYFRSLIPPSLKIIKIGEYNSLIHVFIAFFIIKFQYHHRYYKLLPIIDLHKHIRNVERRKIYFTIRFSVGVLWLYKGEILLYLQLYGGENCCIAIFRGNCHMAIFLGGGKMARERSITRI